MHSKSKMISSTSWRPRLLSLQKSFAPELVSHIFLIYHAFKTCTLCNIAPSWDPIVVPCKYSINILCHLLKQLSDNNNFVTDWSRLCVCRFDFNKFLHPIAYLVNIRHTLFNDLTEILLSFFLYYRSSFKTCSLVCSDCIVIACSIYSRALLCLF